jgi:hypothetical protein
MHRERASNSIREWQIILDLEEVVFVIGKTRNYRG